MAAEAYDDRIFMLTPSASSTDVIADKDNVYQVCFTDPDAGRRFRPVHRRATAWATKVAVIYNNGDAYSTGIYQTFEAKAAELGLEIVSVTTFTDDTNRLLRAAHRGRRTPAPTWSSCPSTTPPLP